MAIVLDIIGTSENSFNLNGKVTMHQGDDTPLALLGVDGDVYFRSNGVIYCKQNGSWINITSASLPDASTGPGQFIVSNGQNYEFYDLSVDEIVFKSESGEIEGDNTFTGNNTYSGSNTFTGQTTFTQPINGTAMYAYWGDLAEYYESDENYSAGTLVKFGGEKEITIADDVVNAVISTRPGFTLNNQLENGLPIALCGRVPVRVIGKVKKFDYLVLSEIAGVARSLNDEQSLEDKGLKIIARALESKDTEDEGLILCVVKFKL